MECEKEASAEAVFEAIVFELCLTEDNAKPSIGIPFAAH
jgi:hypothetical protein